MYMASWCLENRLCATSSLNSQSSVFPKNLDEVNIYTGYTFELD